MIGSSAVKWVSAGLLLFSFYIYYQPTLLEDHDLWFHLQYGRHFIENLTWNIDHTIYSWTPVDPHWKYVTWIGSSLLYLVYRIASFPGLYVLEYSLFAAVAVLWVRYLRTAGGKFDVTSIAILLAVFVSINPSANFLKPELFSVILFTLTVFIHFHARTSSGHLFAAYPLLFLLWTNTHGGFVIGLLYLAIVLVGETVNLWTFPGGPIGKRKLLAFAAASAISLAVTLINPAGISYHVQLFRDFFSSRSMGHLGFISAYQSQWHYLIPTTYNFRSVNSARLMVFMALFVLGLSLYGIRKRRRADAAVLLASAVLFYLGMQVNRLLIFFPVAWLFFSIDLLRQNALLPHKRSVTLLSMAVLLLLSANVAYNTYFYVERTSRWHPDMEELAPVREIQYLKEAGVPGPLFNDYNIGAYLMWALYPEQKVFIDSRYWPYAKTVIPDYADVSADPLPEKVVWFTAKYPFKAAIIQLSELPVILWMIDNPEWRLMYFNRNAAVIVHKSVIEHLTDRAFNVDVSPSRFRDVRNPIVLMRLFDIYLNINVDPRYPKAMYDIYLNNVPDRYRNRAQHIAYMEENLQGITQRPGATPAWAVPR